jgi:hypothetical protein
MGTKCPILHAKEDQVHPIGFRDEGLAGLLSRDPLAQIPIHFVKDGIGKGPRFGFALAGMWMPPSHLVPTSSCSTLTPGHARLTRIMLPTSSIVSTASQVCLAVNAARANAIQMVVRGSEGKCVSTSKTSSLHFD